MLRRRSCSERSIRPQAAGYVPQALQGCADLRQFPRLRGRGVLRRGYSGRLPLLRYEGCQARYAFGHGLSYSKFEISDLTLDHTVVNYDNEETLTASVKVRNVSDRAGKEVVQIYISDVKSTLDKPVKELKAFRKVLLQPSEEQVLTFQITKDMLKSYDPEHKCWDCEAGYYEVLAGNASDNISCKAKFLVKCRSIYNYNEKTMLCVIHADERAAKIIDAQLEALHIDVSDMADALYYFPHREIGQVLHSMLDHAPIDEAVKKQAYEQIFEAVGALDISEL